MKYYITYNCGHTGTVDLGGKGAERERRIKGLERGNCPECEKTRKQKDLNENYEVLEMHYGEYKNNYSDCKTVADSYDPQNKTIKVYVSKVGLAAVELAKEAAEAQKAGFTAEQQEAFKLKIQAEADRLGISNEDMMRKAYSACARILQGK